MSRRGMISPVFKYIFIGIVGVIILSFFVRFAFKQVETSDTITEFTEVRTFEDMLISFSISGESVTPANFNTKDKLSLDPFSCDSLIAGDTRLKTSKVIFSPAEFNSDFYIWSVDWKYPYKITNLFYVSDKETMFVLVGGDLAKSLKRVRDNQGNSNRDSIPDVFSVDYQKQIDENYVNGLTEKYNKVRIIFVDGTNNIKNVKNDKLEVVEVKTNKCKDETNCFGSVVANGKEYAFFSRALLYGAVFSSNYGCSYKRALSAMSVVSGVYYSKAGELSTKVTGCDYSNLRSIFLQKAKTGSEFFDRATKLDNANKKLREEDCETVF
ncbi:MAG: hypothetical protein PHT54_04925 [Candidatus Nanoarchaeia archaeon]|nr:hypothetical protein [Candidatus Nanoarchaeia archaeon]